MATVSNFRHAMNKLVLYCLFFLLNNAVFSQYYFRGAITDEKKKALANVKIYIHSSRTQYMSGIAGDFGIPLPNIKDTITLTLEGYEIKKQAIKADVWTDIILKAQSSNVNKSKPKLISVTKDLQQTAKYRWNISDETYFQQIENENINAEKFPNTGFSINVNKASYSNMRRFINMGSTPPPDAVRIEELTNYFNLYYQQPTANEYFNVRHKISNCPWNSNKQLLHLNISAKKLDLENLAAANFVFLIDVSGSMDMPNRLPLLKAAFQMLVKNLRDKDTVTIVTYGGYTGVHMHATCGAEKDKILESIEKLEAVGDTPGESAIIMAYKQARLHFIKGGTNRVILATDGDFNVGRVTEKELEELITKEKQSGVNLTCLGVGMGNYKDSKLETLAKRGNGNLAYIDDIKEAEKILVKELTQTVYTVADNVFLNIAFNKEIVKEYRLIGFDNKKDAVADSTNDMDGGEVGSGSSIIALVEIEGKKNVDIKEGNIATVALRFKPFGKDKIETQTKNLSYKPENFDSLDLELRFATAVAMFGMRMRESKFAKDITWENVEQIASKSYKQDNYLQSEFFQLVQRAKRICTSKKKKKG